MEPGTLRSCEDLLKSLLPHLGSVLVEQVSVESRVSRIVARTRGEVALPCPDCGARSRRRHSGYRRTAADGAVGGRMVVITLEVRRLFCDDSRCERMTFAGQAGVPASGGLPSCLGEPVSAQDLVVAQPGLESL